MQTKDKQATNNIERYVAQEQRTFAEKPLTDADLVAFCALLYGEFERYDHFQAPDASTPLADLPRYGSIYSYVEHDYNPKGMEPLFNELVKSRRFSGVPLEHFTCIVDEQRGIQFGAICYPLAPDLVIVAFRGTDSKYVGWFEDFNLARLMPIPGQDEALRYLTAAAREYYPQSQLVVCGHSKGGNEAEYAALHAPQDIQERIIRVVSFDGPGIYKLGNDQTPELSAYDTHVDECYEAAGSIALPICRYIFPSSLGLLFEPRDLEALIQSGQFIFTRSTDKQMKHNLCSVKIVGGNIATRVPDREKLAAKINTFMFIKGLSVEQRTFIAEEVIDVCRERGLIIGANDESTSDIVRAIAARVVFYPAAKKRLAAGILRKLPVAKLLKG